MAGVRSKDHGEKRQRILDTAAGLFARQGFNKTSIAEISSGCNASKAWIYHYFPNKEDILFTLLRNFLLELQGRLANASLPVDSDGNPVARLRSFIRECLQIYDDYRINYPVLFNEMRYLPEPQQAELREIEKQTVKNLEDILVAIRPEMAGADNRRRPLALLVFGTINWTYTWFEPEGKMSADDLTEMSIRLIVSGLKGPNILD
jgi:AcrR family transcriptional regulator